MTEAERLLNCPFCDGEGFVDSFMRKNGRGYVNHYVLCMKCHSKTAECGTRSKAIELWNTRATPSPEVEWPLKKFPDKDFKKNYDDGYISGFNTAIEFCKQAYAEAHKIKPDAWKKKPEPDRNYDKDWFNETC